MLLNAILAVIQIGVLASTAVRYRGRRRAARVATFDDAASRFRDVLLVFLLANVSVLLLSYGFFLADDSNALPFTWPSLLLRVVLRSAPALLLFCAFYGCVIYRYRIRIKNLIINKNVTWQHQVWNGLLVGVFISILKVTVLALSKTEQAQYWQVDPFIWWPLFRGFPILTFLDIGFSVGVVPIIEEIVFRGYLYPLLRDYMRIALALPISVGCWLLGHSVGSLSGVIGIVMLGLILTLLYERTRSVLSCIITHCIVNASWTLTLVYSFIVSSVG